MLIFTFDELHLLDDADVIFHSFTEISQIIDVQVLTFLGRVETAS